MRYQTSILCLLALLPVSCASDSGGAKPEAPKPLSQRINENNGYKQDAEGNWLPQTNKRSSFENEGRSAYFKGDYAKKQFQTTEYSKKSWWGNKDYGHKTYAGNTDGTRFQQSSRLDGQGAREAGKSAGTSDVFATNDYATSAAREAGTTRIDRPSDAETDIRRKAYQAPEIIDWRQQRSLSLEQSKGILGR